ncbi:transcription factor HES-1-like [Sceloporus undulatus]|uniref:transcription factor HES-1-like n=1 Tax=Sceloporus undulatus TaxID=8520 RepID=UPI001C4D7202|nr:transcription factor HES-1-like [Sceloporus undulatus]
MSQINAMNYPAPPPPLSASFGQALVPIPTAPAPPTGSAAPCKPSSNPVAPGETPKVYGGFQLVPASNGQFAFLIPNPAFAPHSSAVIPLYASAGIGSGGLLPPTAAVSPGSGQSLPADSIWRPW